MSEKKKWGNQLLLLCCLLGIVGLGWISMEKNKALFLENQTKILGIAYQENPDVCKEILFQMFDSNTKTQQNAGEEALRDLGYTKDGLDYWYKDSEARKVQIWIFAAQGICVLVLGCMVLKILQWRKKERLYQYEKETLKAQLSAKEEYSQKREKQVQQFIENIAHQIKTPLSCISTSLDLLLYELEDEKKQRVQDCFFYLQKIEGLMKRLMEIGRLEAGKILMKKEPFFMKNLLEECKNSLNIEERLKLQTEQTVTEPYYGDYEWLKEAFMNILKNCMEHSPKKEMIHINFSQTKEGICVAIRDFGKGIEAEDLPYIFDRFYNPRQEKTSHVGIGLNLAKLVIEKHFGTIKAENHPQGGAVFTIVLPLYDLKKEKI